MKYWVWRRVRNRVLEIQKINKKDETDVIFEYYQVRNNQYVKLPNLYDFKMDHRGKVVENFYQRQTT